MPGCSLPNLRAGAAAVPRRCIKATARLMVPPGSRIMYGLTVSYSMCAATDTGVQAASGPALRHPRSRMAQRREAEQNLGTGDRPQLASIFNTAFAGLVRRLAAVLQVEMR